MQSHSCKLLQDRTLEISDLKKQNCSLLIPDKTSFISAIQCTEIKQFFKSTLVQFYPLFSTIVAVFFVWLLCRFGTRSERRNINTEMAFYHSTEFAFSLIFMRNEAFGTLSFLQIGNLIFVLGPSLHLPQRTSQNLTVEIFFVC